MPVILFRNEIDDFQDDDVSTGYAFNQEDIRLKRTLIIGLIQPGTAALYPLLTAYSISLLRMNATNLG